MTEKVNLKFDWIDYDYSKMSFVEKWLDEEAVRSTGLDDGWFEFNDYWCNESNTVYGKNYWSKVVFENGKPFAVIAIGFGGGKHNIMELVVDPRERNSGKGTELIKELLSFSSEIINTKINIAEAVIYPSNPASKRAFEKAGFLLEKAHADGDALYYTYRPMRNTRKS